MNRKEKIFIMGKCQEHFARAQNIRLQNPYMCLEELGKARALKEIIEKFIDCQSNPYYKNYMVIVRLSNLF